jgi:hypothetical protein
MLAVGSLELWISLRVGAPSYLCLVYLVSLILVQRADRGVLHRHQLSSVDLVFGLWYYDVRMQA